MISVSNRNDIDDELRIAVLRQLSWAGRTGIEVCAREGAVTLTGFLQGYSLKIAIEETVKSVNGVRGVVNNIRVVTKACGEHYAVAARPA
jgi:osmotically-inducible protein OsmY